MKILLDFIAFQNGGGSGGAANFNIAVIERVVEKKDASIELFGVYDSLYPNGELSNIQKVSSVYKIPLIDIRKESLSEIIKRKGIDVFYIGIGQFYGAYDLSGIKCKTIMFIQDIFDIERNDNGLDLILLDKNSDGLYPYSKRVINLVSGRWKRQMKKTYDNIMPLYTSSMTVPYTVSNYTKNAIQYYFPKMKREIKVCHTPLKHIRINENIENKELKKIIESGNPYLFMVSANRRYKNPKNIIKAFLRLKEEYPDLYLVTLKYGKKVDNRHIDIGFLSDSDLQHAYKHAKALLFCSYFEGFGLPPVEAMKYLTPTVASNVTSIPEILGDAAFYCSPYYPADIYRAIKFVINNPNYKDQAMKVRFKELAEIEKKHFSALIDDLFSLKIN